MLYSEEKRKRYRTREKKKKKKKEQLRGGRLEKEDSQERELCVEKKIKRREQSIVVFEKYN